MLKSICTLLCLSLAFTAGAQSLPQLQNAVNTLDKDPELRSGTWSISVIDMSSGKYLLSHNGDKSLATASTMKAVTTASSMAILGTDFRFQTLLQHDGTIENGRLKGNLYIKGEGDPSLGSHRFDAKYKLAQLMITWAEQIKLAGISSIEGSVIADASFLGSQMVPDNWTWDDISNYYGAGPCGLNIHENFYRLDFKSRTTGSRTEILRTDPAMPNMIFHNEVIARGSSDNAYIYGAPYTYETYLRGSIPPNRAVFSIKGAIPDPAWYCAYRLSEELKKCGVKVSEAPISVRQLQNLGLYKKSSRKLLYTHESPPLRDIVKQTNMESINLYAEALLLRAAKEHQRAGSTAQAASWMEAYWREQGVSTKGMSIMDGSGLSPSNGMSTRQMAKILYFASRKPYGIALESSLPLAGRSGSLKSMLKGTAAEGKLRAKSGYISGARGYTGYVTTSNGKKLAFSMLANRYSCSAGAMRRKFETLMAKIAEGR
ncbi:MAG: D-alanyl-D-alanine carboxypeptidase/D-alanyl-D-alanine-endopeptidase [Bacteroidota bacterium]